MLVFSWKSRYGMSNRIKKRTTLYIQTIGFATDVTTSKRHNTTISAQCSQRTTATVSSFTAIQYTEYIKKSNRKEKNVRFACCVWWWCFRLRLRQRHQKCRSKSTKRSNDKAAMTVLNYEFFCSISSGVFFFHWNSLVTLLNDDHDLLNRDPEKNKKKTISFI